jgi:hypothetical protein
MEHLRRELLERAEKNYKKIYPVGTRNSFAECFTLQGDKLLFWFDTEDRSTHMVMQSLSEAV